MQKGFVNSEYNFAGFYYVFSSDIFVLVSSLRNLSKLRLLPASDSTKTAAKKQQTLQIR